MTQAEIKRANALKWVCEEADPKSRGFRFTAYMLAIAGPEAMGYSSAEEARYKQGVPSSTFHRLVSALSEKFGIVPAWRIGANVRPEKFGLKRVDQVACGMDGQLTGAGPSSGEFSAGLGPVGANKKMDVLWDESRVVRMPQSPSDDDAFFEGLEDIFPSENAA